MGQEQEIELKFSVPQEAIANIASHPAIVAIQSKPATNRHFRTTYFDTPVLALRTQGSILRVRHDIRHNTTIQTIKMPEAAPKATAISPRREWEWKISGETPDTDVVRTAGIHALLPEGALEALTPIFTGDIHRTEILLAPPGGLVELAIDHGELRSGASVSPVCEIELELKEGPRTLIYDTALALCAAGLPLRISTISKARRGFSLAMATPLAAPLVLPPPALLENMPAGQAFRMLAAANLSLILSNMESALDGRDIEGVHQMRLALRRLRSIFSFFHPILPRDVLPDIRTGLKHMTQVLGPERDLDVFIAETLPRLSGEKPPALLMQRARTRQKAMHAKTEALLKDTATTIILLKTCRFLEDERCMKKEAQRSLSTCAPAWLDKMHAKILHAGRHFSHLPEKELHSLRTRIKKLNMAIAATQTLFASPEAERFALAASTLGKALGRYNNACFARDMLKKLAGKGKPPALLANRLAQQLATLREKDAPEAWKTFKTTRPYWE